MAIKSPWWLGVVAVVTLAALIEVHAASQADEVQTLEDLEALDADPADDALAIRNKVRDDLRNVEKKQVSTFAEANNLMAKEVAAAHARSQARMAGNNATGVAQEQAVWDKFHAERLAADLVVDNLKKEKMRLQMNSTLTHEVYLSAEKQQKALLAQQQKDAKLKAEKDRLDKAAADKAAEDQRLADLAIQQAKDKAEAVQRRFIAGQAKELKGRVDKEEQALVNFSNAFDTARTESQNFGSKVQHLRSISDRPRSAEEQKVVQEDLMKAVMAQGNADSAAEAALSRKSEVLHRLVKSFKDYLALPPPVTPEELKKIREEEHKAEIQVNDVEALKKVLADKKEADAKALREQMEAEAKAKAEAEAKAKAEAEAKAKAEADAKAKEEADRKAKEEADRQSSLERSAKNVAKAAAKAAKKAAKKAFKAVGKLGRRRKKN